MDLIFNVKGAAGEFYGSLGTTIVEEDPESICGCWTRVWQWLGDFKEKAF